jgi:hypothetical protein
MNVKSHLIAVIPSGVEAATQPRTLLMRGEAFDAVANSQLSSRDMIRSLSARSADGLPVYVASSPAAPFSTSLDTAGGRYSSIARRTSLTVAATGFNSLSCLIITSGSFKPWPVTVQTIRLPFGISRNEHAASRESQHLKSPAIEAALAGSTKTPSCCASHLCAARMSASLRTSIAPRDSAMAARACCQLAGFPIRIADAIVSGFSMMRS